VSSSLWQLTRARILLFIREPGTLFWVFLFPALLATALGIAFQSPVPDPSRVGIVEAHSSSDRLHSLLTKHVDNVALVKLADDAAAKRAVIRGSVDIVVTADFRADPPKLDYRWDPARSQAQTARLVIDQKLQKALGRGDVAVISEHTEQAVGGRYIDFLLPGLIALNLMGGSMWGIGYAITEARRRRILRAFAVTPMRRYEFLLAYVLGRVAFMAVEVGLLVLFGWLAFDVPVQGSLFTLFLLSFFGAMSFAGIALVVASRASAAEVSQGLQNVVQLPMWLLSGIFFSYERFPEEVHEAIEGLPLTALVNALRGIMNDAAGLTDLLPELWVLTFWGVVSFLLALKLFKWQ